MGDHFRVQKGATRSLDYSSDDAYYSTRLVFRLIFWVSLRVKGSGFRV